MKYIFPGVLCKANCNLEPLAQLAKSQFCMTKKKKNYCGFCDVFLDMYVYDKVKKKKTDRSL